MSATLSPSPKQQFFDANGAPLVGGKLYSYTAGTTSPLATYVDSAGTTTNTNPIILDSRGEANVWLGANTYKLALYSATDVLIWTVDDITAAATDTLAVLAASGGSNLIGYLPAGTGAVATTVQTKLRETVSVKDFGAVGDYSFGSGTGTDNVTAFRAAVATGATRIYVPDGIYYLSDGVALGYGQGIYGDGYREKTWLVFKDTLTTTSYGISLGDGGWCEKLRISKQTNVKTGTGIDFNVTASTSKWCRVRDVYLDDWNIGIWTSSYYHTIDGAILAGNNYGVKIGGSASFYSGSVTLTGCYFKDNYQAGLQVSALTNTNACYNCTWETNQVHVICDGSLSIVDGYLADPPVNCIQGTGSVHIALSGLADGTLYAGSDGTPYGKNVITTDYAYALRANYAVVENATLGINEQSRSTPSPGTVLRGSVIGEGRYVMNNVRLSTQPTSDALNVLEQSSTITQQFLSNGVPIKNYVNNGLFLDRTNAANALYISANGGLVAGANNPWGGGVLQMTRFGSQIRWTVPQNNVGKQHYLMVFKGIVSGTGSITAGPGIDTASSTNLTFDVATADVVQIGSQYTANVYALVGGATQGSRTTLGLSVVLVTPTATTGLLRLSMNASDATTYMQIHGIVMTERNEVGNTQSEGWPIGWFDTANAALI